MAQRSQMDGAHPRSYLLKTTMAVKRTGQHLFRTLPGLVGDRSPFNGTGPTKGEQRSPRLPIELCELIIDFCAEFWSWAIPYPRYQPDEALGTLLACALTCRSWTIRSCMRLARLRSIYVVTTEDGGATDFDPLLEKCPTLRLKVRLEPVKAEAVNIHDNLLWTLPNVTIPSRVCGVQNLWIGRCRLSFPSDTQPFALVTNLALTHVTFDSLAEFQRIITSLVSLNNLMLRYLRWTQEASQSDFEHHRSCPVRLSVLNLMPDRRWLLDARSKLLVEWLAISGIVSRLCCLFMSNTVGITILDEDMLHAFRSVVAAAQGTLKRVELGFGTAIEFSVCK